MRVHKRGLIHVRAGLLPSTDQSESRSYPHGCAYLQSSVWMRSQDVRNLPPHMQEEYSYTSSAFTADTECRSAVVSAAESIGGAASSNARDLQGLAAGIRSAAETLGAYLPWPLADPTVALGADLANIVALQPTLEGVSRLLVIAPHEH